MAQERARPDPEVKRRKCPRRSRRPSGPGGAAPASSPAALPARRCRAPSRDTAGPQQENPIPLDVSVAAGVLRKFMALHPSSYCEEKDFISVQPVSRRGDLFFYGI